MWTLFWRIIKDRRTSLIIFSVSGILLLWMYIAMFPSFADQAEDFNKLMDTYPKGFMEAFGIDESSNVFSSVEAFVSIEHFSLIWPIMMIFMMIGLAGNGLAGQIEQGTVEILLSRPISRLKIYLARYLAGIFSLVVFGICSVFVAIPLASLHGVETSFMPYLIIFILGMMFGLAVLSIAMFLSAVFSEKGKTNMIMGGIVIGMYVLHLVSVLQDQFDILKYFSFFYYYDFNAATRYTTISVESSAVFLTVIVVLGIAGAWWYNRRDIATP
ncbi:MAG: ABC transporter permease subunit [Patescibacteria group bacterium]